MKPAKELDYYKDYGLQFIRQTGILSTLNENRETERQQTELDEMCIAVGLTFEAIQREIQAKRRGELHKAQARQSIAQTNWMLEMSDTEFFDALQRLGDFSQLTVDQWISDERVDYEAKTD